MNQILSSKEATSKDSSNKSSRKKMNFNFFKFQFIFCLFFAIMITGYYLYVQYDKNKKEALSNEILDRLSITNLYENNDSSYTAFRTSNENVYQTDSVGFSVIGLIEIKAIGINYPIINEFSYELLKIAPCKFSGPNPNEVGNLCIAGHNYNNYQFFSRLKKLNNGDIIDIYDLSGQKVTYEVYESYETDYDDLSCTNQNTNGKREITLITCNNIKNRRRVIKAIEKG